MSAWVSPRRAMSGSVTVAVTNDSVLSVAAAAVASNAFAPFHGQSNLTAQYGLSYEQAHPTSGILCDVTEDGASSSGHTAIDWGAKGCYDPTGKRVMWASCGAGNNGVGGKVYNTHAIYDEAQNRWTANRNFQSPNESNTNPIVHLYDGMALDVVGRKFYRKKFPEQFILIYDLTANAWVNGIVGPSGESVYARTGALEFIPTRGTQGELWQFGYDSDNDTPKLWKYDVASATWITAIASGNLGPQGSLSGTFMSYNPRAFGGVGGVLVGNSSASSLYTIRCDNLVVSSCSQSPSTIAQSNNMHVCRDPVGTGWLHFANNGNVYRCDGSTWALRYSAMPGRLNGQFLAMISVPIDAYGVVWNVIEAGTGDRAWLYRP